jgi:hypothetical protein
MRSIGLPDVKLMLVVGLEKGQGSAVPPNGPIQGSRP